MTTPIEWNGIKYPSQRALARATSTSEATVSQLKYSKTLENLGRGRGQNAARPFTFDGITYSSKVELARLCGYSNGGLRAALKTNRLDDIRKKLK